mgnify:FL=1
MHRLLPSLLVVLTLSGWSSLETRSASDSPTCLIPVSGPEYYEIDLVGTRKVRGARMAKGIGEVTYASSPFGVAISATGTYVVSLNLSMENVTLDDGSSLVAWVTTPQLDQIEPLGRFSEELRVDGQTDWNKFLLVVTLEPASGDLGDIWSGPIVARGMSRSGLMHTMAGHGPFETEPCAVYGY